MRLFVVLALMCAFLGAVGCDSAPPPAAKEQAAPKIQSGKSASGVGMAAEGH